jgi:hypothetical protein
MSFQQLAVGHLPTTAVGFIGVLLAFGEFQHQDDFNVMSS